MKKFLLSLLGVITCICAQATDYKLVTSPSDLKVDANYIIVASYTDTKTSTTTWYAMGIYADGNNFPNVAISAPTDNIVKINSEQVSVISLESSKNSSYPYQLNAGEKGYLYAAGTGKKNNYLKATTGTLSATAQATITIATTGSAATIEFNNSSAPNSLRFNSSAKLFSCYSTTQTDVYLYKEVTTPGGGEGTKAEAGLAYTPTEVTLVEGETLTQPTLAYPNTLTVTYASDNEAVATVNATTGEISLAGSLGTAVITASTEGDETYEAGSATFTITVAKRFVYNDTRAVLVTDVNALQPGDVIIIAAYGSTKAGDTWANVMSTSSDDSGNRFKTQNATFNTDKSEINTISNNFLLLELEQYTRTEDEKEVQYWAFKTLNLGTNGYLGNTTAQNYLRVLTGDVTDNSLAKIKITDNVAKILLNKGTTPANSGTKNINWLQYNQGSTWYSCYGAEQTNGEVYIYRLEGSTTITGETAECTPSVENGNTTLKANSYFYTNSDATEFVVKMNGVEINATVEKADDLVSVDMVGLPYVPGAVFTISPVVEGKELHPVTLGITIPTLPVVDFSANNSVLYFDADKYATAEKCYLDAWTYLTVNFKETAESGNYLDEKDVRRNLALNFEEFGKNEKQLIGWYDENKDQVQWCQYNFMEVSVVAGKPQITLGAVKPIGELTLNAYFTFNVAPEYASLIATPGSLSAPARVAEGSVVQKVAGNKITVTGLSWPKNEDALVSGVESVVVEGVDGAVEYYNMQGVRVEGELAPGMYIRRQGRSVSKVQIR